MGGAKLEMVFGDARSTPDGGTAISYGLRTPLGVVGVICPWNAPLLLMTWKVAPALACGNTVVVKPSEESPGTASLLGEVMNAAGIPPGVYNVVHGFGPESAGECLTRHKGVAALTFTGETRTGQLTAPVGASVVTPLTTLLAANSSLTSADLKSALGLTVDPLTFNPFATGVNAADALKFATIAKEMGDKDPNFFYKEQVEKALKEWPKK